MDSKFETGDDQALNNLSSLAPPPFVRTYKATCPYCSRRTETKTATKRDVPCFECITTACSTIQKHVRNFLARKKVEQKEMVHRWFVSHGVCGVWVSRMVHSFL